MPDLIALRGDPADRLPGARGVGAKGAAALLRRYASLEAALADGRFAAEAEALRRYRRIATMDAQAPIPPLDDQIPSWEKAAALAREWRLDRLAERLDALAAAARWRPGPAYVAASSLSTAASSGPRLSITVRQTISATTLSYSWR